MENLGIENFWNKMDEKYPAASLAFKKWIDGYKTSVNWNYIFGGYKETGRSIKFHELPYELQMGIMNRFFIELFSSSDEYHAKGQREKQYHEEMEKAMKQLHKKIISIN